METIENEKNYEKITKLMFNKLIRKANIMENKTIGENITLENLNANLVLKREEEIMRNQNFLDILESNVEIIKNEYRDKLGDADYSKTIEILENNICNVQNNIKSLQSESL